MTKPRLLLAAGLLLLAQSAAAQEPIELSGRDWTVRGDWKLAERLGRPAVLVRNAILDLNDVTFGNGTIEFDVAVAGHRSFVGVAFRLQEGGSYEDFYLRPHQSGRFDALQYTPVWHHASAWQLYPEYNASFVIPRDEWLHVRLEVRGETLKAYLGESPGPAMVVDRMRGPDLAGGLALRSFFPQSEEAPGFYPNAFSNFSFTPGAPLQPRAEEAMEETPGLITQWELSQNFAGSPGPVDSYPAERVATASWRTVRSDAIGRVNLAELEGIPEDQDMGLKLARVTVTSDTGRDVKLNFGASDRVSIFLNRRLVFSGDNTYRSRSLRYLGVMTLENDAVYLPLEKGDNELLFAVTEAFGGWGLTARLGGLAGADPPSTRP